VPTIGGEGEGEGPDVEAVVVGELSRLAHVVEPNARERETGGGLWADLLSDGWAVDLMSHEWAVDLFSHGWAYGLILERYSLGGGGGGGGATSAGDGF
jgi:hypothetical protein